MRPPSLLNPLFAALTSLPGIGPKLGKLTRSCSTRAPRVVDLLLHLPSGAIDRRARPKLREVRAGHGRDGRGHGRRASSAAAATARARPIASMPATTAADAHADLLQCRADYLEKLLPPGELRYVSRHRELYDGMLQMVHPDRVVDEAGLDKLPLVEPVYPLTEGL